MGPAMSEEENPKVENNSEGTTESPPKKSKVKWDVLLIVLALVILVASVFVANFSGISETQKRYLGRAVWCVWMAIALCWGIVIYRQRGKAQE